MYWLRYYNKKRHLNYSLLGFFSYQTIDRRDKKMIINIHQHTRALERESDNKHVKTEPPFASFYPPILFVLGASH